MTILFPQLPRNPWWGHGLPHWTKNWIMEAGTVPDQKLSLQEYEKCLNELQKVANVKLVPFPDELDEKGYQEHDFVFVRDHFISNRNGEVIMSNFSAKGRQIEVKHMTRFLQDMGYRTHSLPEKAYAEGGEFYYLSKQGILFAGVSRNNRAGVSAVANFLEPKALCIIETEAFHLDTTTSVLIDTNENFSAVLLCWKLIKNKSSVREFLKKHSLPDIEILPRDAIGERPYPGTMAVNGLSLPGSFVSSHTFATPGMEEKIKQLGIHHIIAPVTQFQLSGGSIHCLTNEL